MKTIVNKETGLVIYCTVLNDISLDKNEIIIDKIGEGNYYNFDTKEFYTI